MSRRLKLALFSTCFNQSSAAGLRSWNMGHALAQLGVILDVYCSQEAGRPDELDPRITYFRVARGPERLAERALRLASRVGERLQLHPVEQAALACQMTYAQRRSAVLRAFAAAFEQGLKRGPPDFVLAVWPGFEPLWAACSASERARAPLAVEFQDPWRHFFPGHLRGLPGRALARSVSQASFLVNVSAPWCRADAADFAKRSVCIPTGFWPLDDGWARGPRRGPLRIAYTGHIKHFDIEPFVKGLAQAARSGVACRFAYMGNDARFVRAAFCGEGMEDALEMHEPASPAEAYRLQRGADALLLFTFPQKPATFGYKYAEIVSHGLPLLLVGPVDVEVESVTRTLVGDLHVCRDADGVAEVVERLDASGEVIARPKREVLGFTWPELAARLLHEIEACLSTRS